MNPLLPRRFRCRARASALPDVARLIPQATSTVLANGLTVVVVPSRRAPVVATALAYRAGTRDEAVGFGGTAHFLEHMMFKGSAEYGPGRIDHLTQMLGGSNNAFTSHDLTLYYFTFAADRWTRALDVEQDRMRGLLLDPVELDSERRVILEEISMYRTEPWDVLDEKVHQDFFPDHAYGRPVLGTRDELARIDRQVLGEFHRRFYSPENAVLAVVGDVDPQRAADEVAARFGALGVPSEPSEPSSRALPESSPASGTRRFERRQGELARFLLALPAPPGNHVDHPTLRLALAVLGSGRSSRLHRALVDEGRLCLWVAADLQESLDAGMVSIAAELVPGVDPARVEEEILRCLADLRREPPTEAEAARALRMEVADWLFDHEKVDQMAFLAATSSCVFDLEHPARYLERMHGASADDLLRVSETYLDVEQRSVLGWSLPE